MSGWHDFWNFWVSQQTVPGNILGDILIGAATFLVGKYKVAPWLHKRHQERVEQAERHHREALASHQRLVDSNQELIASHQRLLDSHQRLIDSHHRLIAHEDELRDVDESLSEQRSEPAPPPPS